MSLPSFHDATIDKWKKKDKETENQQLDWVRSVGVPLKPPPIRVLLDEQCAGLKIFEDDEDPAQKADEIEKVKAKSEPKFRKQAKLRGKIPSDVLDESLPSIRNFRDEYQKQFLAKDEAAIIGVLAQDDITTKPKSKKSKLGKEKRDEPLYVPNVRPSLASIERHVEEMTPNVKYEENTKKMSSKKMEDTNLMPKVSASQPEADTALQTANSEEEEDTMDNSDLPPFMENRNSGPKEWQSPENGNDLNKQSAVVTQSQTGAVHQVGKHEMHVHNYDTHSEDVNIWTMETTNKFLLAQEVEAANKLLLAQQTKDEQTNEDDEVEEEEEERVEEKKPRQSRLTPFAKRMHRLRDSATRQFNLSSDEPKTRFSSPKRPVRVLSENDKLKKREPLKKPEIKKKETTVSSPDFFNFFTRSQTKKETSKKSESVKSKSKPLLYSYKSKSNDPKTAKGVKEVITSTLANDLAMSAMEGNSKNEDKSEKGGKKSTQSKVKKPDGKGTEPETEPQSQGEQYSPEEQKARELAYDFGLFERSREPVIDAPVLTRRQRHAGELPRRILLPRRLPTEFEIVHEEEPLEIFTTAAEPQPVSEEETRKFKQFVESMSKRRKQFGEMRPDKRLWLEPTKEEVFEKEPNKRDKFIYEIFTMGSSPSEPAPPDEDFPHVFTGPKSSAKASVPPTHVQAKDKVDIRDIPKDYDYYDYEDGDVDDYDYIVVTDPRGEVLKPIPKCEPGRKIPLAAI